VNILKQCPVNFTPLENGNSLKRGKLSVSETEMMVINKKLWHGKSISPVINKKLWHGKRFSPVIIKKLWHGKRFSLVIIKKLWHGKCSATVKLEALMMNIRLNFSILNSYISIQ